LQGYEPRTQPPPTRHSSSQNPTGCRSPRSIHGGRATRIGSQNWETSVTTTDHYRIAGYQSVSRPAPACRVSPGQKAMGFSTSEGGPPRERVCGPPGVITSNYLRRPLCYASSGLGGGPRALWMLEAAEGGTMLHAQGHKAWAAVLPVPPPPRSTRSM
jgi:hypothetical protein